MVTSTPVEERYSRQADLVPADKMKDTIFTIVGVGAIGRQIALQLATIGAHKIHIVDFDKVEEANLGAQGFFEEDLGKPKVTAIEDTIKKINPKCKVIADNNRFIADDPVGSVLFCCVDSIEIREFIWKAVKSKVDLFIDGRMSAEALRVLVHTKNADEQAFYESTLFRPDEAFQGACTAKTTYYSSNVVSGMMVASFAKWLRGMPYDLDVQFNLLTNELDAKSLRDIQREATQAAIVEAADKEEEEDAISILASGAACAIPTYEAEE